MKPSREVDNRARSRRRSRRARSCARERRTRTDTDSIAAQLARPGGVARKTPRTKRKEAARKKSDAKLETPAPKHLHPQSRNGAASIHIYKALSKDEIRLLVLQPGLKDQPLECRLEDSKLCGPISSEYEALSYFWGSEVSPRTITFCSHEFDVGQNLFDALLELRQCNSERVLWIDALCINQCDTTEKSHQVLVMNKIYERAKEVIAWLGPVTEDEYQGLERLYTTGTLGMDGLFVLHEPPVRKAIELLMSRPYWGRAWIVQEIAFARSVRIQCGRYSMPYERLKEILEMRSRGISAILTPGELSTVFVPPTRFPKRLLGPRYASSGTSDGIHPDVFLDSLLDRECSNPRDSVFAFYNLFPEKLRRRINLDYELEPETVLLQAVSAIIKTTQSLSAVTIRSRQQAPTGEAHIWQEDMPSWCPYISASFENDSLAAWQSSPFLDVDNLEIPVDTDKGHVHTYGFTIGAISEILSCGEPLVSGDKENFSDSEAGNILRQFSVWKKYGLSIPEYDGTSEAPQSVLCISSASGVKSQSTNSRHLSEALYYCRKMRKRQVCKVETANLGAFSAVGVVPVTALRGDKICWILGCPSALVLRMSKLEGNRDQLYKVIGEAYIENVAEPVDITKPELFVLQ